MAEYVPDPEILASEPDESAGVPAPDPEPVRLSLSDIFNLHYTTILPTLFGRGNDSATNTRDKLRLREIAADVALRLTTAYIARTDA